MNKFTFITLMMILGISSVSFGKTYLCLPSNGILLTGNQYHNIPEPTLNENKFMVKTEGNNRKMISVKPFGEKGIICSVGEKLVRGGKVTSGIGVSIKGGDYLTCRHPVLLKNGGYTNFEFILNIKKNEFTSYTMDLEFIKGEKVGVIQSGKCEEI